MPSVSERQRRFMGADEAAYFAGLLDGEGYFGLCRKDKPSRGKHYVRYETFIVLTMTSKEFLEAMALMVPWGGGTVGRNARTQVGRAKPAWRVKWSGTAATEVCRAILPYIRLKRRHTELLLALATAKAVAQPERSGRGRAYPIWIVQMQDEMAAEFKRLNHRGVGGEVSASKERASA